jgi:LemA protein
MTTQLLAALLVLAVLVFWIIGAHNRLVALRNQINGAWGRVQDALAPRATAMQALVQALREPMGSEVSALDTWAATQQAAAQAAAAMSNKPVSMAHAVAWLSAEVAMSAAGTRVLALLQQNVELIVQSHVAESLTQWRQADQQLLFARQLFNDAAGAYNNAATQFPTQLVARALGLELSGLL